MDSEHKKEYQDLLKDYIKKLTKMQLDLDRSQSVLGVNGFDNTPLVMALKSAEDTQNHIRQFFAWNKVKLCSN